MTRALLDVNILLALFDQDHVDHRRARDWLDVEISHGWASCAITQNGFVRIVTQPRYPNPITPKQAIDKLGQAASTDYHEFWSCTTSLVDEQTVDRSRLHGNRQVTDVYLLSLAAANGGRLVTFDRSIPLSAVPDADEHNLVVL